MQQRTLRPYSYRAITITKEDSKTVENRVDRNLEHTIRTYDNSIQRGRRARRDAAEDLMSYAW